MKKVYGLLVIAFFLVSCATKKEEQDLPAENIYNEAFDNLEKTSYKKAAEGFEKVEIDHPYSKWAVKAKLMGAYSYYKDEDYDNAILAVDRFIKYHPGNKDVDYAYYLKGMCYYVQISSSEKDQGNTEKAEEAFTRLISLFPNSKYAEDAKNKINLTEDYKAAQEMVIARYYLNQKNYLSALNRFNVVIENYQTTVQIEEALYRQVEIYTILGLSKYADGYYKILKMNYSEGEWTAKAKQLIDDNQKVNKEEVTEKTVEETKEEIKKEIKEEVPVTETEDKTVWQKMGSWFSTSENQEEVGEKTVEETKEEIKKETKEEVPVTETEDKTVWQKMGSWFSTNENQEEVAEPEPLAQIDVKELPTAKHLDDSTESVSLWDNIKGWFTSSDEQITNENTVENSQQNITENNASEAVLIQNESQKVSNSNNKHVETANKNSIGDILSTRKISVSPNNVSAKNVSNKKISVKKSTTKSVSKRKVSKRKASAKKTTMKKVKNNA